MVQINAVFNPFRMKLSRKEPISLSIDITNDSKEAKMLTLSVMLNKQLSLEKSGYRTEAMERIAGLKPGEKKKFYYQVFPKAGTRTQEQPITVRVLEHYQNFNYIANEYKKNMLLKVED